MLSTSKKIICAVLFITIALSLVAYSASSGKSKQNQQESDQAAPDCSESTKIATTPTNTAPSVKVVPTEPQFEPNNATIPSEVVHTHEYSISVVSPSCTEKGYSLHSCICGEKYNGEYTNPVGHIWSAWVTTKNASVSAEGEEQRTCSACNLSETRKTDKLKESNTSTQRPSYTTFSNPLNTYTTQNKPYLDWKGDTEYAAWIGIYTVGTSKDTETAIVSEFEKRYGFTPTAKVECKKEGIYQVDGYADPQTIYQYTITDKTYLYITNDMYTVYTQQCDDGSLWCGHCIYATMDNVSEEMSTAQVQSLQNEMFAKFAAMTGHDIEYMRAHKDEYALGWISEAGTVRTSEGLAKVLYIYCRTK